MMETFKGKKVPLYFTTATYREGEEILASCVVSSKLREVGCEDIQCRDCVFNTSYTPTIAYDFLLHIGKITKEKRLEILLDKGV